MAGQSEIKVIRKRPEIRSIEHGQICEEGRELLERLVRGIVDHPDTVRVTYTCGEKTTIYKVECDQKCLGQIIGAKGKNITGIRSIISATMALKGVRAIVEIPYYCLDT